MNKLIITVPVIAIAGLSLAACSSQSAPASHPAATHSAAAPASSVAAKPAVPAIGQPVKAGVFTFTVTQFKCGLTALGQPGNYSEGKPSLPMHGQFCVAVVSETNTSSQPQSFAISAQMAATNGSTNANDTDPVTLTNAQIEFLPAALQQSEVSQSQVNPGTTYQDVFVWDVPANLSAASVTIDTNGIDSSEGSATVSVKP